MARKNNVKSENPGSILFDTRTRAVMAGPDSTDNIKEKVQSVREVVPGKSNNEIVLVLQYYDYNVEKAIQAYLEDGAKEALGEWHVPAAKPNKKKKNKKKAANSGQTDSGTPTPTGGATPLSATSSTQPLPQRVPSASNRVHSSSSKPSLPNGTVDTADGVKDVAVTSSTQLDRAAAGEPSPSASINSPTTTVSTTSKHHHHAHAVDAYASGSHGHGHAHGHAHRNRTASERSTASSVGAGGDNHARRLFHGLEKSIKDLQRQTTSLERLRLLLDREIDRSYKSVKTVFDEMRTHLNTREKEIMSEVDVVKQQAYEVFKMRQEKAAALKVHIERAEKLSESELGDLRADVKHFVADRKIDEELGKTTRFQYDSDHLKKEILNFGEVLPVKCSYTLRRPSVSSVASSGPGAEEAQPSPSLNPAPVSVPPITLPASEEQGSNQMTTEELASLQMRLQNSLKLQGLKDNGRVPTNGTVTSTSIKDDGQQSKSGRHRNRNRDHQEQQKKQEEVGTTSTPPEESSSRAATPSSTHASAGSASPSPQRGQRSPQRGSGYSPQRGMGYSPQRGGGYSPQRGGGYRGRGRGGQGSGGYRGGQNQGRGSPRRPYSGSRGGGRGGGGDHNKQSRPVVVNGTSS